MAAGEFTVFKAADEAFLRGEHDLINDQIVLAIIDGSVNPTASDATPRFGAGSGVDYDANEVLASANYSAGGIVLANPTITTVGTVTTYSTDAYNLTKEVGAFTNGRWGIMYNNTATNKDAIGFYDFGAVVSLVAGDIQINLPTGWIQSGPGTLS